MAGEASIDGQEVGTNVGSDVLFENDRVRVWRMTLAPGESSEIHRHLTDHVFVYATPGRMEVEQFDGTPSNTQPSDEGFTYYREVGPEGMPPHRLHNVGETTATHYIVELLGPSAADSVQAPRHNDRLLGE